MSEQYTEKKEPIDTATQATLLTLSASSKDCQLITALRNKPFGPVELICGGDSAYDDWREGFSPKFVSMAKKVYARVGTITNSPPNMSLKSIVQEIDEKVVAAVLRSIDAKNGLDDSGKPLEQIQEDLADDTHDDTFPRNPLTTISDYPDQTATSW